MELKQIGEILLKHVDVKGLEKDLAILVVMPFLAKIVADSTNKFDDAAFAYVKEYVEKML
jgi:hypothetical protein